MWNLHPKISSSNHDDAVRLLVGKEYIVGRKDCPVMIKQDPSISRKHAVINVQHDISHLGDSSQIPEVILTDSSKYGTSVNDVKVMQPTRLKSGDEILFGNHHSYYRLTYTPLVVVTSCLDNNKKKLLKHQIHQLGGHLLNEWKSNCVTHLVMDGLLFTIKVIHALAECSPIVTPKMFDEIIKAVQSSSSLPAPQKFLPPLKEESIKSDGPLFLPDNRRKTLFNGKTFLFLSSKQYKRTHAAIEMCGGQTILKDSITNKLEDERIFIKDECSVMMVDPKEREGYSLEMKQWITQIMDFLKNHNKRPIPESELGLAILQMTLTNYCNPDIAAVPALTHNIVCQSLDVGLDDMSQVFSPQNKTRVNQKTFKKPSVTAVEDIEKKPDIVFLGTAVARQSSTSTATKPRHSPPERGPGSITTKNVVLETQDFTPKSLKMKTNNMISPIPDTLNVSGRDVNVLAEDTPLKDTKKTSVSSVLSSVFASDVKHKIVIPDSEGLSSTKSGALAEIGNESFNEKTNERFLEKESLKACKLDVVPDSLGMDSSVLTPRKSRNSLHSSQEGGEESDCTTLKRTRVSDSAGDFGLAEGVIPTKRARNGSVFESPEQGVSSEGLESNDRKRGMFKEEKQCEDGTKSDLNQVLQPENRMDGFLSTKIHKKQMKPEPNAEEDDQPRNLVVVNVVSLIVQKSKYKEAAAPTQITGKNFKNFRKQWYAGCERRFPKIIGGSDLVVHHAATGVDQEDWFIEAREANKEQDKRDRMEEELFMSDAGIPQGRKRRGR